MGARPTIFAVALALGPGNTYVDVSSYLEATEDFTYTWGRSSEFDDTDASEFSPVVANAYGCFTPGNVPTYVTPGILAAATAAGDTSFQYATALPAGSFVVVDVGASAELVITGAPTGSGPFNIPVAYPMMFPHAVAVAVGAALPLTEGMGVSWQLNSRLVSGTITGIEPEFPNDESAWEQVRVTADDALGTASRFTFANPVSAMILAGNPSQYWALDDAAGASSAASSVVGGHSLIISGGGANFGAEGLLGGELNITTVAGGPPCSLLVSPAGSPGLPGYSFPGGTRTLSYIGLSVTPTLLASAGDWAATTVWDSSAAGGETAGFSIGAGGFLVGTVTVGGVSATATSTVQLVPGELSVIYLQIGYTLAGGGFTYFANLYVNGVMVATGMSAPTSSEPGLLVVAGSGITVAAAPYDINFSNFSVGTHLNHEEYAYAGATASERLTLIALAAGLPMAALPSNLPSAPLGFKSMAGQSALDAINDVIRTVQGSVTTLTSGALTSPVQTIVVRGADRPTDVMAAQTYDLEADLTGSPKFSRDVTHTFETINATGVDNDGNAVTVTVTDASLEKRVGNSSSSFDTLWSAYADLYVAASDALNRGRNPSMVASNTIVDARISETDRWTSLLGQVAGDRIRLTDTPVTQLGFAIWDGWLLGASETHNLSSSEFELMLDPCSAATAIFDTDLFANGGNNLISGITATALTMLCGSGDGVTAFETGTLNYYLQLDSEQVKVTACTALISGGQNLTILRGQNGTVPAPHGNGAVPEVITNSIFSLAS